jgi:hypothetical protein
MSPEKVAQLVEDLGEDRVHVIMTIRSIDGLVPSAWQQQVKTMVTAQSYGEFLDRVLPADEEAAESLSFWHNQGASGLIERWSRVLPPARIIAVAADPSDRRQLPRAFEQLLGLPDSLLATNTPVPGNQSLTWERVELIRRVNVVAQRNGWSRRVHRHVNHALIRGMSGATEPDPQPIPGFPSKTAERAARMSRHRAEALEQALVHVVGDPATLHYGGGLEADELPDEPATIGIDTVVAAIEQLVAGIVDGELAKLVVEEAANAAGEKASGPADSGQGGRVPVASPRRPSLLRRAVRRGIRLVRR